MTGSDIKQNSSQHRCDNCGEVGSAHEKERVSAGGGQYYYHYYYPDESGRRYTR